MLTPDHFPIFVSEVHDGRSPFPWQQALLNRIVDQQRWPEAVDVPTGLGKTSVLDIAVFVAALGGQPARRRIFYVVDRRLVVDEAYEHAVRISEALSNPGPRRVTAAVARRLILTEETDEADTGMGTAVEASPRMRVVVETTRMRGGTTWDRTWLDRPDRYAVITGTVDQVGSRLLFRGYGVDERARSIDAALVGTDSLILVDEAHLSQAFVTTASAALAVDQTSVAPKPVIVTMSATSGSAVNDVHSISEADERHPVVGARLYAAKRLRLVEVRPGKSHAERDVSAAMAGLAIRLLSGHGAAGGAASDRKHPGQGMSGRVVGVVVNTVARARAIFELVRAGSAGSSTAGDEHDAVLLTGRSRPVDRDYLMKQFYPRMSVDRAARTGGRPLVVVATQTVEVGANIDFDALVTDSAPMSSLVQRLGRLNRLGACPDVPAVALVVHDSTVDENDPVYGRARLATWRWLSSQVSPMKLGPRLDPLDGARDQGLDASPAALRHMLANCPPEDAVLMRPVTPYVPVLHRAIVDSWVRTLPVPEPDQPVEPFLHGVREGSPPVTVVWRTGLGEPSRWARLLDEVPPAAEEGLEVSIQAVRRWLRDRTEDTATHDLDTPAAEAGDASGTPADLSVLRPAIGTVLRYRRGNSELIEHRDITPGNTIIVPVEAGGCDDFGWYPTCTDPAADVADLALRRGRPVIRLGPALVTVAVKWADPLVPLVHKLLDQAATDAETEVWQIAPYRRILELMRTELTTGSQSDTPLCAVVEAMLAGDPRVAMTPGDSRPARTQDDRATGVDYHGLLRVRSARLCDDSTAMGSSATRGRVELDAHQRAVARRATEFARNLALPRQVISSVTAAARWHDEGKRDPRFQVMLWGGDHAAAEVADHLLAKSGMDTTNRSALRRARQAAGYPPHLRHEALSARVAALRVAGDEDIDAELVVHLVASHHGWSRPLLPPVIDPSPQKVDLEELGILDTDHTIDWSQPHRFAALNVTYGRWGLALLETIVRLADIWCSRYDEQCVDHNQDPYEYRTSAP